MSSSNNMVDNIFPISDNVEETWADATTSFDPFCSDYELPVDDSLPSSSSYHQEEQMLAGLGFSDGGGGDDDDDDLTFDHFSSLDTFLEEESNANVVDSEVRDGAKGLDDENLARPTTGDSRTDISIQGLSAEEITRIAGATFIQSYTKSIDAASVQDNPFDLSLTGLSGEDLENVELVELLLVAAQKVGDQQFNQARRMLSQCQATASDSGNPVQRVVHYFARALRERIDRETGTVVTPNGLVKEGSEGLPPVNIYEKMRAATNNNIQFFERVPFAKIAHFTAMQSIVETVADATKIHVIDLEIRSGMHWTILMQALVSRDGSPVEYLKISAMGNPSSRQLIEEVGKRLSSFADMMNLRFLFKIVGVPSIMEIKEELFDRNADEKVAVFSEYVLTSMIMPCERLDCLMKTIRHLVPSIMVITEVEANHNSPIFVNRFIETLFYTSTFFDCIETCMGRDDPARFFSESVFFGEAVRTVVVKEGEERDIRNVKLDVWRKFFARFRMVETKISESSLYQAELVVEQFPHAQFCTLSNHGNSLLIGWKGTPLHSVSTWKFV